MVVEGDFLGAIEYYGEVFTNAISRVDLDADVPTCPGWKVRDLVAHTAIVYQHKTTTVRDGWVDESPPRPTVASDASDLTAIFTRSLDDLVTTLGSADLTQPTYTWCDHDHTADWWVRRLAHETLIHAADAVVSAGRTPTADPWLALDGVDEILDEMIIGSPPWAQYTEGTDWIDLAAGPRVWRLRTGAWSGTSPHSGRVFSDEPALVFDATGDAGVTVSTDPATLDLWLWGRTELPLDAADGDRELVAFVRAVAAEATG